jgi:hypothetical protein
VHGIDLLNSNCHDYGAQTKRPATERPATKRPWEKTSGGTKRPGEKTSGGTKHPGGQNLRRHNDRQEKTSVGTKRPRGKRKLPARKKVPFDQWEKIS